MNNRQSMVLAVGAIAVIIVLFTAPEVYLIPSSSGHLLIRYDSPPIPYGDVKPTVDLHVAFLRIAGVISETDSFAGQARRKLYPGPLGISPGSSGKCVGSKLKPQSWR